MRGLVIVLLLALTGCAELASPPPTMPVPEQQPELPSVEQVRELLYRCQKVCGFDETEQDEAALMKLGNRAFPAYEAILADPNSEPIPVRQACRMIARLQTDRRRFVPIAIRRATEPDALVHVEKFADNRESVRVGAIKLLGAIGDERDANVLVPLLSNDRVAMRYAATEALAKIGGWPELEAMQACVKAGNVRRDANELRHFKECRDRLEARLKANPIPKHLTN